ncbi:MAG: hypothetical protein DMF66_19300, partial [Acidobacteria bacterium]
RADRQLKIRGFRVEPGEIEADLKRLPGVRECVVLKRADGREDGPLVGYVGLEAGAMADASKLRGRLKRELPDYMIPSAFVFMERLPLTPGGKIDRGALPPPDEAHPDGGEFAAPRTTVEESLAGIWRQLLGVDADTAEGARAVGGRVAAPPSVRSADARRVRGCRRVGAGREPRAAGRAYQARPARRAAPRLSDTGGLALPRVVGGGSLGRTQVFPYGGDVPPRRPARPRHTRARAG